MKNKTIMGVLFAFFLLTVSLQAKKDSQQDPQLVSADELVAKLKFQLELTDKQVDEVRPIIAAFLEQEEQLKLEEKQALSKVLTGDQMYSWNDLQKQQQKEKKKHSKHNTKEKTAGPAQSSVSAQPIQ